MKDEIEVILEECLTELLNEEASVGECVAEYPDQAVILRPLLELASEIDSLERPEMKPAAAKAAKQRMLAALPEKRREAAAPSSTFRRMATQVGALLGGGVQAPPRRAPVANLAIAAAILLMLFVFPNVALQISRGGVVAQTALLADATGVVEVQRRASTDWRPAEAGGLLQAGDSVRTGGFSTVTLTFFDGTKTALAADTEVTVEELNCRRDGAAKTVVLHQWSGSTHNWVQKLLDPASRFELGTSTAVATVHGTEFTVTVSSSDGGTEVVVVEGLVSVETEETTVLLSAGQSTATTPHYVLAPPPATPTEEPGDGAEPTETPEPTAEQWRTVIRRLIPTPTAASQPTATAEPTGTPEPTPTGALAGGPAGDGGHPEHPEHPEHPHGGPPGRDEDRPDKPGKDK